MSLPPVITGGFQLHFFHQVNAKIATAPSDPNVAKSVENIRQRCSHYKDNKFEFLSPFCIDHHFVVVKIILDLRSPDIFHEVSVYDSLIKGGRRNNSVHRNSPPAKYLRPFQQFIANFCLFGNPKCEVLLANPDHIVEKAVYRSCPLQQNGFDCGLFAFGCVLHLLKGLDVSADIFNQQHISKLRESLHAVFTLTDNVPNPGELLSSSFLSSFFPLQSENACHDDVFLRLLQDLPNNDNDIDAAPDVPDKAPLLELNVAPLNPRLWADPQPEPTRHRDNYFTTQFIEVPKEFEDMSKVDASVLGSCGALCSTTARMWRDGSGSWSYPVSFAIMKDGEDVEGWKWFLELLVQAVPLLKMLHPDNRCRFCYFTFMSDRQKELIQALQQVFPDNHHCFCSVHIARNVEKDVGKQVAIHVYALSATFSKRESDDLMAKINAISVRGKKYLEGISANQWRSTAWVDDPTLPPRFGIVTTNISESANSMVGDARTGSWLECTNNIVRTMMNRICSLREENYGREGVVDKVAGILERRWKNCSNFQVREVVKGGSQFDVFRPSRGASQPETNRLLDVREQTCECGKRQEHGDPCIDADPTTGCLRCKQCNTSWTIMSANIIKTKTVNELLKENIVPVSLDVKKRFRKRSCFSDDADKSFIVCSICKKRGHNIKTCLAREQIEKQHPAELDLS
ncbi:MULE transposase domain containing protein [Nitzschia inconspicua]|uniref:MULE transposase domain containing protein n=1 Tax=Nitzschia inconspicua TaxID=303405 RepID=A0A9K3KU23_9STRA|nr:MULE transposase domain containing protein [Nitzschia inconspicua]